MSDVLSHLGSNTKYETPDAYDSTLLERIERAPRRIGYIQMHGYDVWTAYEFTFLLQSGLPVYKVIRIHTDCNNPYIFESKSLKLYLNSFTNTKFDDVDHALETVRNDLTVCAGGRVRVVEVNEFPESGKIYYKSTMLESSKIFNSCDKPDKTLLKSVDGSGYQQVQSGFTDLLRTNCELTNQADVARCFISVITNKKLLDRNSFLHYIVSYRNHQEFHEPTCEHIFQDLNELLKPIQLLVICQYTRRGGIDINPIRSLKPIDEDICFDLPKLLQQ